MGTTINERVYIYNLLVLLADERNARLTDETFLLEVANETGMDIEYIKMIIDE